MSIKDKSLLKKKFNQFIILGLVILFASCNKKVEINKENLKVNSDLSVEQKKGIAEQDLVNYLKSAPTIRSNKSNGEPSRCWIMTK